VTTYWVSELEHQGSKVAKSQGRPVDVFRSTITAADILGSILDYRARCSGHSPGLAWLVYRLRYLVVVGDKKENAMFGSGLKLSKLLILIVLAEGEGFSANVFLLNREF
jgi:hypothetical protein